MSADTLFCNGDKMKKLLRPLSASLIVFATASAINAQEDALTLEDAPASLDTVLVPEPTNLKRFVRDEVALQTLGKALFWDMQVGSDGRTACATCHSHAGADSRVRNTLAPAHNSEDFPEFRGANVALETADFPFHHLADRFDRNSRVKRDTSEVVGSAGVVTKDFVGVVEGSAIEEGTLADPGVFQIEGAATRQVTSRNAPTVFNSVLFDRLFWDGRANRFFNGVNIMGEQDPKARIYRAATAGEPAVKKKILLDNAAMASLAVGPPLSDVEMSFKGRTFPDIGHKMLMLTPLALQRVHKQDSLLGPYAVRTGNRRGLTISYDELIRKAFKPVWWQGSDGAEGYTHMESNFSLYWGLAIQAYQSLLISDDAPYDRWARGDESALTEQQKNGLLIFMNEGRCSACHDTPAFTIATRQFMLDNPDEILDDMAGADGNAKLYDIGFNNTAVRPAEQDIGQGGTHGGNKFFSLSLRAIDGQDLSRYEAPSGTPLATPAPDDPHMENGAFKVPTLRNIELTGPYMHNGGLRTLDEVIDFYVRGTDFFDNGDPNDPLSTNANVDSDVAGIPELVNDKQGRKDLVAFLKSLTDRRVKYEKAPFDHPELFIPNGHSGVEDGVALDETIVVRPVGKKGRKRVRTFVEILRADENTRD